MILPKNVWIRKNYDVIFLASAHEMASSNVTVQPIIVEFRNLFEILCAYRILQIKKKLFSSMRINPFQQLILTIKVISIKNAILYLLTFEFSDFRTFVPF